MTNAEAECTSRRVSGAVYGALIIERYAPKQRARVEEIAASALDSIQGAEIDRELLICKHESSALLQLSWDGMSSDDQQSFVFESGPELAATLARGVDSPVWSCAFTSRHVVWITALRVAPSGDVLAELTASSYEEAPFLYSRVAEFVSWDPRAVALETAELVMNGQQPPSWLRERAVITKRRLRGAAPPSPPFEPGIVRAALAELAGHAAGLQPGKRDLDRLRSAFGHHAPAELVEWYATYNGQSPGRSIHPAGRPRCRLLSLDEAMNRRSTQKGRSWEESRYWLPLAVTEDDERVIYFLDSNPKDDRCGWVEEPGQRPIRLGDWIASVTKGWNEQASAPRFVACIRREARPHHANTHGLVSVRVFERSAGDHRSMPRTCTY
jgi:hypothetical protein